MRLFVSFRKRGMECTLLRIQRSDYLIAETVIFVIEKTHPVHHHKRIFDTAKYKYW
jgi:hypothetical protein